MSDDELDRDWKPSNRPQSTMARSFSLALNDLFKIDNSVADLDAAVSEKKQKVSSQTSELEALEARLRATEERLAASIARSGQPSPSGRYSPRPRPPVGDAFSSPSAQEKLSSPLASNFNGSQHPGAPIATKPISAARPNSAWKGEPHPAYAGGPMPGALPPSPGASEGDYELQRLLNNLEDVVFAKMIMANADLKA